MDDSVKNGRKISRARVSDGPAKVWMDYAYYPATTAHYIRRAFEKNHSVVTSGGSITPDILKMWNLENMKAGILPQDIPRNGLPDARSIYKNMPKGFSPEFFLWVETGLESPPAGLEQLPLPKAAYLIDTHINLEMHLQLARQFDVIFLAQREYVEQFRKSGIKNVHWLPLGCDPQIHGALKVSKLYDVGFAGSITKSHAHDRRRELLEKLKSTVNLEVRRVFLEEMAHLFSSSRIVFNNAIKNDLNMRVFEALCSGSLLLTDDAEGVSDLFTDKKDLVIYNDANIAELARYYLENDDEREEIARAGREKVLAHHTYAHRADKMVETMRGLAGSITVRSEKPDSYYRGERPEVMEMVPQGAMRILEVGCGAGVTSRMLKEENSGREMVGVESDAAAAKEASKYLDRVFHGNVEKMRLPYPDGYFDCIIYADVLEHLREPGKLLEKHKRLLSNDGIMVMSIPNTKHFSVVNQLMEGRWEYVESGLLDSTHIRFFTLTEIKEMLKGCGLSPLEIRAKRADKVYKEGSRGTLKIGRWQIDNLSEEEMLDFFVLRYLVTVRKEPEHAAVKEPFDPERFKAMIAANDAVLKTFGEPFASVGASIARNENKKAAELLAGLKDEKDSARLCWIGRFNMALGLFREAEAVYRSLDDEKFTGCALAARGLLFEGLSCWWKARDEEAAGWLDLYGNGRCGREESFLAAAEDGNGVRFSTYDKFTDPLPDSKLDYISSYHRLENEADVVQTLIDWRGAIKDGGVLALLCAHSSSDETQIYPLPKHRFTPQSLEKIVGLIGTLQTIAVKDVYEGKSFVLILQKGEKRSNGGRFDYEGRLQKLLSRHALEKSSVYREKEQPEAAAQCVEAALFLHPENPTALTMLGDCLMKKDDASTAARFYQKAISLSGSAASLIGMGTLKLIEADFESALDCFEKAVSKETENDRAICGLGISTFNLGRREEGFELYQKAFEINPENTVALSSIVKAGYALKKPGPAENALMKFLELHPANVDILFSLAGIRFFAGKMEEAGEILEKVFLFAPDYEDAKRLYEKIEMEKKGSRV